MLYLAALTRCPEFLRRNPGPAFECAPEAGLLAVSQSLRHLVKWHARLGKIDSSQSLALALNQLVISHLMACEPYLQGSD
jgi:hypothetical protein